jgi:hypothetical protein
MALKTLLKRLGLIFAAVGVRVAHDYDNGNSKRKYCNYNGTFHLEVLHASDAAVSAAICPNQCATYHNCRGL